MPHTHVFAGHVAVRPLAMDTVFLSKDVLLDHEMSAPASSTQAGLVDLSTVERNGTTGVDVQPLSASPGDRLNPSETAPAVTTAESSASTNVMGIAVTVRTDPLARQDTPKAAPSGQQKALARAASCGVVRMASVDGGRYLMSLPRPLLDTAASRTQNSNKSNVDTRSGSHILVARLLTPVQDDGHGLPGCSPNSLSAGFDGSAPGQHVVAHLPFPRFAGVVRDYTTPTIRFNESVLALAWEEKVGWRATSPLIVPSEAGEREARRSISSERGDAADEEGEGDVRREASTAAPTAEVELKRHSMYDDEEEDPARCQNILWQEEAAIEAHYGQYLRHRFLVTDPDHAHAIWALQVHVPSGEVTVVPPAEFFTPSHTSSALEASRHRSKSGTADAMGRASLVADSEIRASATRDGLLADLLSTAPRTEGSPEVAATARGHVTEVAETVEEALEPDHSRAASPIVPAQGTPDGAQEETARAATNSHNPAVIVTPPTREATTARTASTSSTATTATAVAAHTVLKHACVPLMGGAKGFLDGHMSVARFNAPTALCWRTDPVAAQTRPARQQQQQQQQKQSDTGSSLLDALFSSPTRSGLSATDTSVNTSLFPSRVAGEDSLLRACARGGGSGGQTCSSASVLSSCEMLFISDSGNHAIRYANFRNRLVRTVAGLSGVPGYRDGSCTSSLLANATAMAWCTSGLVFSDGPNGVVRLITGIGSRPSASTAEGTLSSSSSPTSTPAVLSATTPTTQPEHVKGETVMVELSPQVSPSQHSNAPVLSEVAEAAAKDSERDRTTMGSVPCQAPDICTPPRHDGEPQEAASGSAAPLEKTPVRAPAGLPPRSPRTPSPVPASQHSARYQEPQQEQQQRQSQRREPRDGKGVRRHGSSESREEALRRPRVWTVAGAPPLPASTPAAKSRGAAEGAGLVHYIDAQLPQRASFGYPADIAFWPDEVDASVARLLIADAAFSAVRVLDRDGVQTFISPIDYPDETSEEGHDDANRTEAGAAGDTAVPPGLSRVGCVLPLAFIQERTPWVAHVDDTPEPYLHASKLILLVGSTTMNAATLLCPTSLSVLERLALNVHAEEMTRAHHHEPPPPPMHAEDDAQDALLRRVAERVEEEEQRMMQIGLIPSGRRTVGELGMPSLRRLVLPMVGEALGESQGGAQRHTASATTTHEKEEEVEMHIADLARRLARCRAQEQYLRLHFPFVLPPPLVHTDHRTFPHLYCFVSGSRGRARVGPQMGTDGAQLEQSRSAARQVLSAGYDTHNAHISAQDLLFCPSPSPQVTTTAAPTVAPAAAAGQGMAGAIAHTGDEEEEEDVELEAGVPPPPCRNTVGPGLPVGDESGSETASVMSASLSSVEEQEMGSEDDVSNTSLTHSQHDGKDATSAASISEEEEEEEEIEEDANVVDLSYMRHARGAGNVHGVSRYALDAYGSEGFNKLTSDDRLTRAALVDAEVRAHWAQVVTRRAGRGQGRRPAHERAYRVSHAAHYRVEDDTNISVGALSSVSASSSAQAAAARRRHAREAKRVQRRTPSQTTKGRGLHTGPHVASRATAAAVGEGAKGKNASQSTAEGKKRKTLKNSKKPRQEEPVQKIGAEGTAACGECVLPTPQLPDPVDDALAAAAAAAASYDRAVASLRTLFLFFADRRVVYRAPPSTEISTSASAMAAGYGRETNEAAAEGLQGAVPTSPRLRRTPVAEARSGLVITPRAGQSGICGGKTCGRSTHLSQAVSQRVGGVSAPLSAPSQHIPVSVHTISLTAFWRLLFYVGYLAGPTELARRGSPEDVENSSVASASVDGVRGPDSNMHTSLPSFTVGFALAQEARTQHGSTTATRAKRDTARPSTTHARQQQQSRSSAPAVAPPAGNTALPISTQDPRSVVECLYLYACRACPHGQAPSCPTSASRPLSGTARGEDGLTFAGFRRVMLLLWSWQHTLATQAQRRRSLDTVARAFAEQRRRSASQALRPEEAEEDKRSTAQQQEQNMSSEQHAPEPSEMGMPHIMTQTQAQLEQESTAVEELTTLRDRADQLTRDTQAAQFGWLDRVPLIDALPEDHVVEAYVRTVELACQRVPGFIAFLREKNTASTRATPHASACLARTTAQASMNTSAPSVSAVADTSEALVGLSPIPMLRPPTSVISSSSVLRETQQQQQRQSQLPRGAGAAAEAPLSFPRTVVAADALLRLLSVNEAGLRSLFHAYSEVTLVRRSAAYAPPHAVLQCALTSASPSAPSDTQRRARSAAATRKVGPGEEQDVIWKISQLLCPTAEAQRSRQGADTVEVRCVSFVNFRSLLQTLDIFPSLMNRTLMEVAYMDALTRPLYQSSSDGLYARASALAEHNANEVSARTATKSAATGDFTVLDVAGSSKLVVEEKEEDVHMLDNYTRDHSALTFLAFVEAFVRVGLTVFSQLGEADATAYPSAVEKVTALMAWTNRQVQMGHVEKKTRTITRSLAPLFPHDFPLFQLAKAASTR